MEFIQISNRTKRLEHEMTVLPKGIFCLYCEDISKDKRSLVTHLQVAHNRRRMYQCPICHDAFLSGFFTFGHLFKEHGKTRRQLKAFRNKIGPYPLSRLRKRSSQAAPSKDVPIVECMEEDADEKWIHEWESNTLSPKCGGCGADFQNLKELGVHTAECKEREQVMLKIDIKKKKIQVNLTNTPDSINKH